MKQGILEHALENQRLDKGYRQKGVCVFETGVFENGEKAYYYALGTQKLAHLVRNPGWKVVQEIGPVVE